MMIDNTCPGFEYAPRTGRPDSFVLFLKQQIMESDVPRMLFELNKVTRGGELVLPDDPDERREEIQSFFGLLIGFELRLGISPSSPDVQQAALLAMVDVQYNNGGKR